MSKYSIYFWTPEISPHLLPLFYALKKSGRVSNIKYIAQSQLSAERKKLGWSIDDVEEIDFIVGPTRYQVHEIVEKSSDNSIHIFAGIRWFPCIIYGLEAVQIAGRRFGVLSEPRVLEGLKGALRLLQSWATEGNIRRRCDFILAIGAYGPDWFRIAGYPQNKIFPFAYFLTNYHKGATSRTHENLNVPVVAYLGRLERQKGFELFLSGISNFKKRILVKIAGSGSGEYLALNAQLRSNNLEFFGPISMSRVPEFLSGVDILVLPSLTKDDGWGAVVSEALMAGVAVIVSYRVGASMCVDDTRRGTVLRSLDAKTLSQAIVDIIERGIISSELREYRALWASSRLDSEAGAKYMLSIFDHIYFKESRPISFL